jgi:EmrB/QacA subfamily drug resistance transporter
MSTADTGQERLRDGGATGQPAIGPAWLVLALSCAAEFMVVLDSSVVNVALPGIQADLGFSPDGLQWVITSYALVFAGFLLLGGRLADLYGRRRVFLWGLVVFVLASVAGGLATTPAVLVAARAVQALGAAVLAPASLTILTTTYEDGPARVRALGIWTALASGAGAAGSLLGGLLTEYLTWRATLLINFPIGAVALPVAVRALRSGDHDTRATSTRGAARLDVAGAVSVTTGLVALTFAISGVEVRGWGSPVTLAGLVMAVIALSVFVLNESRWSRSPLLPLRLFRARSISVGNVAMLLAGACLMPMWYFSSLYMQQALGLSAAQAGLGFLPHTLITVLIGAQVAPRLMARVPARALLGIGSLIAAAGFWWQSAITPSDTYFTGVLGPAVLMSVGTGLLNTPLTTLVTAGIDKSDAGAASGLMNTAKQVGGALGLAGLLTAALSITDSGPANAQPRALVTTIGAVFALMALVMVAVALLAFLLPRPPRGRDSSSRVSRAEGRDQATEEVDYDTERSEMNVDPLGSLHLRVEDFYVRRLKALDRGDADAWSRTFTENGSFSTNVRVGATHGRAAIRDEVARAHAGLVQRSAHRRHWLGMLSVDERGDGTVHTSFYALVYEVAHGGVAALSASTTGESLLEQADDGRFLVREEKIRRDDLVPV